MLKIVDDEVIDVSKELEELEIDVEIFQDRK